MCVAHGAPRALLHHGRCSSIQQTRTLPHPAATPHPSKQAPPQREVFLVRRREEGGVPAELLEVLTTHYLLLTTYYLLLTTY